MLPAIVVALSVPPARDVQPLAPEKHLAKLTTTTDALCGDGDACDFDPKIAGLATACSLRNSNGLPLFADVEGLTNACVTLNAKGWENADTYSNFNPANNDTDNADLVRNDRGDCVLAFHGSDLTELNGGGKAGNLTFFAPTTAYGLDTPTIGTGYIEELEGILAVIRAKHGNLSNWAHNVCPGRLYMAGQSLGGAMAAIFAFWANHASDPLEMGKPVTALYLFGADAPGPTGLTNGQRADGCFDGTLYYGRAVAGVVPGYPALPDVIVSSAMNMDTGEMDFSSRWVQTKIAWSSLDFAGSTAVAANRLGPGVQTPCGGLPEAYQEVIANNTVSYKAFQEIAFAWGAQVGVHEPIGMVW